MPQPRQAIQLRPWGDEPLAVLLKLETPPFFPKAKAHRQLSYVEDYARQHGARSVVVERHYIDRDHMEDHGVFYSKNLFQYPNACERIHFFSIGTARLGRELRRLRAAARHDNFATECAEFSKRFYLGFCVIKPLSGCPVGRTVLRCFAQEAEVGYRDLFNCAREYEAHLLGTRLSIYGLAFQQQDLGVSACATTALWSALQKARELEESGTATPAQITMRASQFALPFGRAMPSEGLSVDQMCQAVHSLGYAPYLFRAEDFTESRALLYSAVLSGISPVLILARPNSKHAVAVAGMKVRDPHLENSVADLCDDRSGDLVQLYLHDDRYGPYRPARIHKRKRLLVEISLRDSPSETSELSHILVPMHPKIRLSFGGLRNTALQLVQSVHSYRRTVLGVQPTVTSWECQLRRAHSYVESLMRNDDVADSVIEKLCKSIPFSRYLAVVRIQASDLDPIDVLLDSTSTERNLNGLAVVQTAGSLPCSAAVAALLGVQYQCSVIG